MVRFYLPLLRELIFLGRLMPLRRNRFRKRFRRRRFGRKNFTRRRGALRSTWSMRAQPRQSSIYKFIRSATDAQNDVVYSRVGNQAAGNGYFSYFSLDTLPAYTELTALYDQYRIDYIECIFRSMYSSMFTFSDEAVVQTLPYCYIAVDYNDATAPTSKGQVLQYTNCRVMNPTKDYKFIVRPRIAINVYDGMISTAYTTTNYANWINSDTADVPHYGLKIWWDPCNMNGMARLGWQPQFKYHLSFRNTK